MPTLRELTEAIQERHGVKAVVILGADGLLIETHESAHNQAEALAARVPAVAAAVSQLSDAASAGEALTVIMEYQHGYGIVLRLSDQVLLFVSASPDIALADLLFDLRRHSSAMAALV